MRLLGEHLLLVLLQLGHSRLRPILPRGFLAREHHDVDESNG
jgi:hypothetical protein